MKKLILSLCILGLAGCGSGSEADNDPNLLVKNDFESLDGWLPEPQSFSISRDKAHSGKCSLKVDRAHEYSATFNKPLAQLQSARPKKLLVSAWTFVPNAQCTATLVTSISDPTTPDAKPLLWDALSLDKAAANGLGKWVKVTKTIVVPETTVPNSKLAFYLWYNSGSQPVYLDDLAVTVEP